MDYKLFFEAYGSAPFNHISFSPEEIYQFFRARLADEYFNMIPTTPERDE